MWRSKETFPPAEPVDTAQLDYTFAPGDKFTMQVFTRRGEQLIDIFGRGETRVGTGGAREIEYFVRTDGMTELPSIGEFEISGKTLLEAQRELEDIYGTFLNDPFVVLNIINHRVFVFFGRGNARVVELPGEKTSLVEVLAIAGGLPQQTKSHRIRIMRGDHQNPDIKVVDMSTVEGWMASEMTIKPNDIIYVEPIRRVGPAFSLILGEITPILSLATTLLTIYLLVRN